MQAVVVGINTYLPPVNADVARRVFTVSKSTAIVICVYAKCVNADTIVTASVSEYMSLKAVEKDVKVISLEELILG